MQRLGKPVSEVCHLFDPLPQILKNVRYSGGQPLQSVHVKAAIAEGEARLGKTGRLVIRPSGTEPKIKFYLFAAAAPCSAAELPAVKQSLQARLDAMDRDLRGIVGG